MACPTECLGVPLRGAQTISLSMQVLTTAPDRCAQCKTAAGSRYLRTLLLQPSTDLDTISARLDCVSELLARDELLVDAHKVMSSDEL